MKAKVFLLLLPCLLFSCSDEIQVEDNRRLFVSGSIAGNEPAGISIVSTGTFDLMSNDNNPDKILGSGKSDQNGKFNFVSLDTYTHDILISVNSETLNDYKDNLGSYYFYDDSGKHQLSYNLGEIDLPQKIIFEFNVRNISGTTDTLYYTFDYEKPVKYFVKSAAGFEDIEENISYRQAYEMLPLSEPRAHQFNVAGGSDLKFSYTFGDQEGEEITIPVNSETTSYDFEY